MEEKFWEKVDEYKKVFNDCPTWMLGDYPPKKAIEMMDKCIKERKDLYELGYFSLDDDVIY